MTSTAADARASGRDPHRTVEHIIVINPLGLSRLRNAHIRAELEKIRAAHGGALDIRHIGVNKNNLDFRASAHRAFVKDNRSWPARAALALGLNRRAENVAERYDHLFTKPPADAPPEEQKKRLRIGHAACTLSHIRAWQLCAAMPADALCMVLEDDALPMPVMNLRRVPWPADADCLHLAPNKIHNYTKHSDALVKLAKVRDLKKINHGTVGYILSPACARRLLSLILPHQINQLIDIKMLLLPVVFYCTRKPWVQHIYTYASTAHTSPSLQRRAATRLRFFLYRRRERLPRGTRRRLERIFPELGARFDEMHQL